MRLTPRLTLLLTLPPLMWAGNALVGRMMVGQVPPLTLNLMRWLLAAVCLLPVGWRVWRKPALIRARLPYLAAVSLLGVGLYNALQYLALVTSTPINVTLVASSMPVWMLVVGMLFYGEHPTRRQLLGALLGLAGVLLVIGRGSWRSLLAVQFVPGDLFIVLAAIGFAFYSWLLARPPASMQGAQRPGPDEGWDWAGLLLVQITLGSAMAGVFAAGEQALGAAPIQWSWGVAASLVFVALGPSLVAYRCWGLGVATAGPALAAFFSNLTPLFAALLSAWVLNEPPQPFHAVAFVLIVGGIAVSTPRAPPARKPGG